MSQPPPQASWFLSAMRWITRSELVKRLERWIDRLLDVPPQSNQSHQERIATEDQADETLERESSEGILNEFEDEESLSFLSHLDHDDDYLELDEIEYFERGSDQPPSDSIEEEIDPQLLGYADRLLKDGQEELQREELESIQTRFADREIGQNFSEGDQYDTSDHTAYPKESASFSGSSGLPPQGIQRIKIRDEERERLKRRRRKKAERARRAQKKSSASTQSSIEDNKEGHRENNSADHMSSKDSEELEARPLNTWRRPPLRSMSKWEKIGYAHINQWQQYSPSSRSMLFGSWLASLDSLVEVHENMIKDQEAFYDLVTHHEEFSSFSPMELDAWWFQLNRVDHFVTEYQFYKRTNSTLGHPIDGLSESSSSESSSPLVEESPSLAESEAPSLEIQEFISENNPSLNPQPSDSSSAPRHEADRHVPSQSYYRTRDQSLDHSLTDDMILRPIKKRKRRRKSLKQVRPKNK